ncbi:MAG: four helix bundle protein [Candidatus Liptonbacteria bacterium]|nr:four helix bundle protein [Candidatus Liptonbacteria bacterium]
MNKETGSTAPHKIKNFTDIIAWQEAHTLVLMIYRITKKFPKEELFSLVDQMRRCIISVSSNIAEGFGRQSYREKIQFYSIAQGSVAELQSQLYAGKDLGYVSAGDFGVAYEQSIKVNKLVNGLIKGARLISA